jgi:excinuclease ABC subunit A
VVKTADWIIDLGPEGGERGGSVVAAGSPEEILRNPKSYTAQALKTFMKNGASRPMNAI